MRLPYPVVLASASPRRQELLRRLVPEFEVLPQHLDEAALGDADPWVAAQRLAREKALAGFAARRDHLVIAADTVVALEGRHGWIQFAKPCDPAEARRMLGELAGREHRVVTGLALRWPKGMEAMTETSRVRFRELSAEEIAAYVATGEPMDKAGAYGLQGGARTFVESVAGSITNVIGLPMERLEEALSRLRSGR
jgi:septum formation protein